MKITGVHLRGKGAMVRRSTAAFCLQLVLFVSQAVASDQAYLQAKMIMPAPKGAQELCQTYKWACARHPRRTLHSSEELALVLNINAKVNATTRPVSDKVQHRRPELWALPTHAGGDCEDFALLKKMELVRLGVNPRRLLLATVLDRKRAPHAVLVYRSHKGDLVLDNLTETVLHWRKSGYVFLRMQNPDRPDQWLGVFRA